MSATTETSITGSGRIEPSACATPCCMRGGQIGGGIADVNLPAGNAERSPVKRKASA
jgi:hypothetical protein